MKRLLPLSLALATFVTAQVVPESTPWTRASCPVRRFTVDRNSIPFPVPKLDDLLGRIPLTPHLRDAEDPHRLPFSPLAAGARGQNVPPPATSDTPGDPKRRAQGFWLTPNGPKRTPKLGPGTVQNQCRRAERLAL